MWLVETVIRATTILKELCMPNGSQLNAVMDELIFFINSLMCTIQT